MRPFIHLEPSETLVNKQVISPTLKHYLSDYNFPIQIGAVEYVKVHSFFAVKLNDLTTVFKVRRKKSSANSVTFAEDTRREDSYTGEGDKKGHLSHST